MTNSETGSGKSKKSKLPLIISGCIIIILVACYFFIPSFKQFANEAVDTLLSGDQERTREWVDQFGYWGPVAIILAQVLQMFLFIVPTVLLMIVSILAYGPWLGSLYALIGIVLASAVAYIIGKSASDQFLDKMLGRKTKEKFIQYVEEYGAWVVALARVNPVLSNDTISFISGIVQLTFWKFLLATIVATIPLLALISYLGNDQERLKTGMIWISAIGLILAGAYFTFNNRKRIKNQFS